YEDEGHSGPKLRGRHRLNKNLDATHFIHIPLFYVPENTVHYERLFPSCSAFVAALYQAAKTWHVDVRKATIFGIASIAILIAGLVIESHFDIFPDDDGD
ncbi:MAG: hypothetical protein WCD60_22125, partial [Pseudolabrys sp.]